MQNILKYLDKINESNYQWLAAIFIVIIGWIYTTRTARQIARRQHTVNIILSEENNDKYQDAIIYLRPYLGGTLAVPTVPLTLHDQQKNITDDEKKLLEFKDATLYIINHFEFLAAGVRNGDLDESLFRDCQKSNCLIIYEKSELYINRIREFLGRPQTYEHFEWLCNRWIDNGSPSVLQRVLERVINKPFRHQTNYIISKALVCIILLSLLLSLITPWISALFT